MSDIVVTVPQKLWADWILEGDAVGEPETGEEWGFFFSTRPMIHLGVPGGFPVVRPGDRVYVVAFGLVRGYAPLTRMQRNPPAFGRKGGAVAVTIPERVQGFPGWKYRWWDRAIEIPFPDWRNPKAILAAPEAQ